ncbi:Maff2 family mobile element protein [Streptococcus pneumoniae]
MEFFTQAVDVLKVLVMAVAAGLGAWGVINLMEGYGNDNPGAKSQGVKQLMAGGGIVLIGLKLIPLLANVLK